MTSHVLPKISFLVNWIKERELWSVDVSLARPKSTNTPLSLKTLQRREEQEPRSWKWLESFCFFGASFSAYLIQHTTVMMMMIERSSKATKYNNKISRWLLYYKSTSLYTLLLFLCACLVHRTFDTYMWHVSVKNAVPISFICLYLFKQCLNLDFCSSFTLIYIDILLDFWGIFFWKQINESIFWCDQLMSRWIKCRNFVSCINF